MYIKQTFKSKGKKDQNSSRKWAKYKDRQGTEEDNQMTHEHMKRCPISFIIIDVN